MGVELGVATEVVKMGERSPEAKEVRPPPSVTISLNVTRVGGAGEPVPLAKAVLAGKFEREKDTVEDLRTYLTDVHRC